MRVRILYHDHCFDGAASAAFFSRFLEGKFHPDAEFEFTGLAHKASQLFEPSLFDGDVNAIVARERFGFAAPDLAELVSWADIIDGAQYANAQEAVELREPAMRLTLVIEGSKGSEPVQTIIRKQARCEDGVVSFDLVDQELEGYNKFIPYYLFPHSVYTVSVLTSSFR